MSRQSQAVSTTTSRRLVVLTPSREDLLDAAALFVLGVLAIVEFQSTFGGATYLVVAVLGLVLGIGISHLANALKQPAVVLIAMGLAAFFLLGGVVALRDAPGASILPTGGTLRSLARTSVQGWKGLLTTLPRVDGVGTLLVLPYILGLFCGLGGFALARRTRASFAPVVAPLAVFVAVILLGSVNPSHVVVLACVFAVIALVWGTLRSQRLRPVVSTGAGASTRYATAGVLLALVGLGAYFGGPNIPGASSHQRVVLRNYVNPPANVDEYPSPLSEFRLYQGKPRVGESLVSKPLFTVGGTLPAGSPIRFATLDSYNGIVWAASTQRGSTLSGDRDSFIRVGQQLDNPAPGPRYSMTVKIDNYDDYWMPESGAVQDISFTDAASAQQTNDFRYNLATGTGVVPSELTDGASYSLTVADVSQPDLQPTDNLASDGDTTPGAFLKSTATTLAGSGGNTTTQVLTMARVLHDTGRFTNGDAGSPFEYYLPGHSVGRLTDFVKGVLPGVLYVGDDEQYSAAYALMIEQLGVPARVVVGVPALPASRVVMGSDVHAWVEVQLTNGSWRTIPTSEFVSQTPPDQRQLQQKQKPEAGSVVPPPAQGRPKTLIDDSAQSVGNSLSNKKGTGSKHSFHLPGWVVTVFTDVGIPIVVLGAIGLAIVGVKEARRRRRRSRGTPSARLARGWKEVTDHARDLGVSVSGRTTRREQAQELQALDVASLASLADARIFGPGDVTEDDVAGFWDEVARARKRMSGTVSRWRRLWAAVNLATFLPALPTGGGS